MCVYHCPSNTTLTVPGIPSAEPRFMPKIKFVKEKKEVEVEPGANLRQVALKEGIQLYPGIHKNWWANCHGLGECASCRVYITKGIENVSPQGWWEKLRFLRGPFTFFARLGHEHELRLACKTRVHGDLVVETQPAMNLHRDQF